MQRLIRPHSVAVIGSSNTPGTFGYRTVQNCSFGFAGKVYPVTQLAGDEKASAAKWDGMPQLTAVNQVRSVKPGATVLMTGTDERGRTEPILVSQPYGRGKSVAFMAQDSWQWQMHATIPLEDQTHENFWRQMLRWLVSDTPRPIDVSTTADRVEPGEAVTIVTPTGGGASAPPRDAYTDVAVNWAIRPSSIRMGWLGSTW